MSARPTDGTDRAVCGECGETIYRPAGANALPWLHVETGVSRCYRDPHTETAWPDTDFLVDLAEPRVLGFLVQCSVCPQRALVATQPSGDWVCPRCAEVTDAPTMAHRTWLPGDDDDYPLSKVQG